MATDLRAQFSDALKTAMKAHDAPRTSTLRMILARLKDLDIAARRLSTPSPTRPCWAPCAAW